MVIPPAYPAAVVYTCGACQNRRSAPQKHPIPKIARSVPSGNGGVIGVPSTRCGPSPGIGSSRPGSASPGAGSSALRKKRIAW